MGSLPLDPSAANAGRASNHAAIMGGAVSGALGVLLCGACAFVLWRRGSGAASAVGTLGKAGGVEVSTAPNDLQSSSMTIMDTSSDSSMAGRRRASRAVRTESRVVRAESVFADSSPKPSSSVGSRFGDVMCEQCRNSGFAVCVHRSMGLVENDSEEDDDDCDELCVVCLDAPREALVVHADEAKSSHRVLCLACAYQVCSAGETF